MSGTYGDVELDGPDIPAVALPRRAKTYDTTKYKKRKMTKATTTAVAPPREWWEEWEDEKLPGRTYNPYAPILASLRLLTPFRLETRRRLSAFIKRRRIFKGR
jgi:hypothetical protein